MRNGSRRERPTCRSGRAAGMGTVSDYLAIMKIYIVCCGWDYEGFTIMGVFDNKASAEKYRENAEGAGRWDSVDIEEHEIGFSTPITWGVREDWKPLKEHE